MIDAELVHAIFDAPIVENGWHTVLELVAARFEPGDVPTLVLRTPHEEDPGEVITTGMSEEDRGRWLQGLERLSGLVRRMATNPPGSVHTWVSSNPEFEGIQWGVDYPSAISGQIWGEGPQFGFLSMSRATEQPFSQAEQTHFGLMIRFLSRAAETHRRLEWLRLERDSARGVLDQLEVGVVLVAAEGDVVHANRKATELLEEGDGVSLEDGRLRAGDDEAQTQLQQTLDASIATALGKASHSGGAVPLPRQSGRDAFEASVAPITLESSSIWHPGRPAAVTFLKDPEDLPQLAPQRLDRLYGLTPTEGQLAGHLARGGSIDSAAREFDRSRDTLRKHLQSTFEKTGTHRQAELVALLLRRSL